MKLEEIYSEQELYPHRIARLVKEAGLFPDPEEEATFEEYVRASSALGRVM